jgi:hypothetical protein
VIRWPSAVHSSGGGTPAAATDGPGKLSGGMQRGHQPRELMREFFGVQPRLTRSVGHVDHRGAIGLHVDLGGGALVSCPP